MASDCREQQTRALFLARQSLTGTDTVAPSKVRALSDTCTCLSCRRANNRASDASAMCPNFEAAQHEAAGCDNNGPPVSIEIEDKSRLPRASTSSHYCFAQIRRAPEPPLSIQPPSSPPLLTNKRRKVLNTAGLRRFRGPASSHSLHSLLTFLSGTLG
ncbi:hypothetical protein BDV95DRAFT_581968 [Massariosphaeria phaeospora]|uniref:Uncharacterized protein n=1 Tax=Massariosphaeria phaeospora TaxID=100035 RepID=A0A7C8I7S7_9PLEO|nr:hypothetical protein BDV95DRAFT_581968 [Massariosphaeria phaeospora]